MPFMAAALPYIALASTLVGTGMSVVGGIAQGQQQSAAYKAQAQAARYNQDVALQSARAAELNAQGVERSREYWTEQQRRKQLQLLGKQAAGYGAAGVMMEGSPLEIMADTAAQQEKEILVGRYNYDVEAANYRNQGARYTSQAGFYDYESERQSGLAGYAQTAGYLKAGTALLTGVGNMAGNLVGNTGIPKYNKLTVPRISTYKNSY